MKRPPLFVELCAGTAALSLRLQSRHARPPVSRMGAKTGYSNAILRVMGLRAGLRAEHYLWCEPDPGCRLLLEAYRDRELAQAAADIIRGWKDEEPRALWERLRDEGPVKEGGGAPEVGRTVVLGMWAYRRMEPDSRWCAVHVPQADEAIVGGGRKPLRNIAEDWSRTADHPATIATDARQVDPREVARWTVGEAWTNSGRYMGPDRPSNCHRPGWVASITLDGVAGRADALPLISATIEPDARRVDPREVARWLVWTAGTTGGVSGAGGFKGLHCRRPNVDGFIPGRQAMADATSALPVMPADITADARTVKPVPPLPPGTIAYMDPPYVGTTGYAADLPREEVVELAHRWHDAGARVYISEAEPLAELDGWHHVEITRCRKGQRRTFSKQQAEWLTCSHPPAWTPDVQVGLFGGAS